jgi:UDPglucose 6-dehydrogenase
MRIAMVGSGYVGLVSGACFSEFGIEVACIDKDARKIERLVAARCRSTSRASTAGRQQRQGRAPLLPHRPRRGVRGADAVFIAVGTPRRRGDGHADLSYVFAAAEEIAARSTGYTVIVTKSTVPVGTGDEVERSSRVASRRRASTSSPTPSSCARARRSSDFMRPDRVVDRRRQTSAPARSCAQLYRPLYLIETPILFTALETAS